MTGIPVVWSHEGTEGEGNEKIGKEKEVKVGVWEEYETALLALLEKRIEQQDSRHNENGETNEHGDSNKGNDNTRQFVGDILKNIWPWELNVSFPLTKLPSSSSFSDSFLDRVHDLADQYDMALSPSSVASDNNLDASGEAKDNDSEPVHRQSRRLLIDAFGASLLHVNALLDQQLGSVSNTRRVPAHMPHFLDKTILQEIHDIWPEQFRATSSHRFRDPTDMQFSFTYFYYLMQATRSFDMDDFFRERLDNDGDGELGWTEVEYLLMLTEKGETPSASKVDQLYKGLVAVSKQQGKGGRIEPSTLSFDPLVHKAVEAVAGKRPKYKHQLQNLDEVEFYMVPANSSKITQHMNHVRYKRSKFICLNDNMDGKDPKATNHAQEALRSFFEAYYPLPSPLELQEHAPDNYIRHLGRDSTYAYTQAPHSPTYATWLLLLLILALVVGIGGWGALTRNNRESPLSSCAALPSLQL